MAYMAAAIGAGLALPRLEHHWWPQLVSSMTPTAAMTISSAIASGMIALTAIVFSLTFVMVQFSATAYSPRLVLWISRDPLMSNALGVFSATFLYALMMTAWVDRDGSGRVPLLSEGLIFGLLLASMSVFVALIDRIGRLQVNRMLIFIGNRGRESITELYAFGGTESSEPPEVLDLDRIATVGHVGRPQVIQAIRVRRLLEVAERRNLRIDVLAAVGDTVVERTPVLRVLGGDKALDLRSLTAAIETGDERTFEQDPKYAIRLLVDIAIRALSPAINDPTTAVQALDQIEDLLIRLSSKRLDVGRFIDRGGRLRVTTPVPTWEDFLRLSFDEILKYGSTSVQVMRRMRALIASLAEVVAGERLAALRRWERRHGDSVEQAFSTEAERRDALAIDRQGLGIGPQP
jgi:uncharacterized membrane protein